MVLLIAFAFLAGIVTILSPCILPVLPVVLSSSVDSSGKRRPLGVVVGFVLSFTFFTLFLSTLVRLSGIPANALRLVSVFVLAIFGLTLLMPKLQLMIERFFGGLARFAPDGKKRTGFKGGLIVGLSLGLLWTPCVGPILASVISLAITGTVSAQTAVIVLAYSLGTAIPLFIIMWMGSTVLSKVPWLARNTIKIQRAFGVLMILTAIGIFLNVDRKFQFWVLQTFPGYGVGLTKIEDNERVRLQLKKINREPVDEGMVGKPSSELTDTKGVPAMELVLGGEWFNSEPLQLKDLRGKVVLIDFWTYSCINCQRTFPYLKSWWEKYEDKGLVIIGVHSPEFEFEKDADNVKKALKDFGLEYPVMQDNGFATWRAYRNRYWPAKYLIDKDGNIRYTHFGEGEYDETEKVIQELLKEAGSKLSFEQVSNEEYKTYARTPELYLGYSRMEYLSSPETAGRGELKTFSPPSRLPMNSFAYQGEWSVMSEYSAPQKGAKLYLNFEAKEVFLVARSKKGVAGKVKVYLDEQVQSLGEDSKEGVVTVDSDGLYKLIDLSLPGRHILRLEFEDDNVEIYAFTFG
jgi:cytochrome c biogenesis protein CcdA/thiol-disulfide isomerase/thioredoxin